MTEHRPWDKPWLTQLFDDTYAQYCLAEIPPAETQAALGFIVEHLRLGPGTTLFDQGCGAGRMCIPLAGQGIRIVGLDCVASYVDKLKSVARDASLPAEFYCDDARTFVSPHPCDGVLSWFNSWGFYQNDEENLQVLKCAFASLRPGGRLLVDYPSMPRVFANFAKAYVEHPQSPELSGAIVIKESEPDFKSGMMTGTWTFIAPDGRREVKNIYLRMFFPHEIIRLFERAGFEAIELFGGVTGESFTRNSKRCIVVGERPR